MQTARHKRLALWAATAALLAVALIWALASYQTNTTYAQSVDPSQIADQFYPQGLAQEATERENLGGTAFSRDFCFAVFDTLPSGDPQTIIAAYTDGIGGAILVISAQGDGSYGVVFEPTEFIFGGFNCKVKLVDLDSDGRNEIRVAFSDYRTFTADWYFRWDGLQLLNLGPTQGDPSVFTVLNTSDPLDLDHDGILEIISIGDSSLLADETGTVPNAPKEVYKSLGGPYTFERTLAYYGFFRRETGAPQMFQEALAFPAEPTGNFVLKVINGKHDGTNRVSSARILLNGVEILSPTHFSQQVEFLSIPVTLVRNNSIEVTLAGKPLGTIIVTIENVSAAGSTP
ncbi:MAG: hypothetical protein ACE5IP_06475 [Terriglobia bacterium]